MAKIEKMLGKTPRCETSTTCRAPDSGEGRPAADESTSYSLAELG